MSKKEQAQKIYDEMVKQGATNDQIVARFIKDLDMTQAGATTYRYNCAKAAKTPTPTTEKINIRTSSGTIHSVKTTKRLVSSEPEELAEPAGKERIDTRQVYTACIVNDDIISETFSYYEKDDALKKSSFVMHSPTENVPVENSRWSQIPKKYLKIA